MKKQATTRCIGLISILFLFIISGCGKTFEMQAMQDSLQRAMGRDIATEREAAEADWCPEITTFEVSPLTAKCGNPVSLEFAATAPYSGELSYVWEIEGQTFDTGYRAEWITPTCETIGDPEKVYTVRGVVSDGECSVTQSVEVTVMCNCAFDAMVHFDFGKAHLDSTAKTALDDIAEKLLQTPEFSILIEGHTDYVGGEPANKALGKKRAEAIKRYLSSQWKIDPDRLVTKSYGENDPIAPNESSSGRAKNRRAEIFRILLTTK